LALGVAIATNCPALNRQLDYLVQDARQDMEIAAHVRFEAILEGRTYRILESGRELGVAHDPIAALDILYSASYARANATFAMGTVFLHAASGRLGDRRFLLIGQSGAGKTTLILHLAEHGVAVEGDEIAILGPQGVAALPRHFHVKGASLTELPWLKPGAERPQYYDNGNGTYVFAVSPARMGFAWDIGWGPVDAVFYLQSNHGGQPRIEEMPRHRMVQLAMKELRLPHPKDRSWLAPLCAMLNRARAYDLTVGHLDKTARLLLSRLSV
jgi:hypothetical protein